MCASFVEKLMKKPWAKYIVTVSQPEVNVQVQDLKKSIIVIDSREGGETVHTMDREVSALVRMQLKQKQLEKIDTRQVLIFTARSQDDDYARSVRGRCVRLGGRVGSMCDLSGLDGESYKTKTYLTAVRRLTI